jgi:hypothetical protein
VVRTQSTGGDERGELTVAAAAVAGVVVTG